MCFFDLMSPLTTLKAFESNCAGTGNFLLASIFCLNSIFRNDLPQVRMKSQRKMSRSTTDGKSIAELDDEKHYSFFFSPNQRMKTLTFALHKTLTTMAAAMKETCSKFIVCIFFHILFLYFILPLIVLK